MIELKELLITEDEIDNFIESLELDKNVDLSSATDFKIFPFNVEDKKYEVRVDKKLMDNGKLIAEVKFYLLNNPKKPDRKNFSNDIQYQIALNKSMVGITGTGNYFSILTKVISIIVKYCNLEKIDYITFTADEENRQSLYAQMLKRLIKKYNIPYKQLAINPLTNTEVGPEEFWLERV